jgi:hypothetical protein
MKKERTNKSNESLIQYSLQEVIPRQIISTEKGKTSGALVANHPTFGVAGGKFCTGPPGRARSPGVNCDLFPDHPPNSITCSLMTKTDSYPVLKGHLNEVRQLPEINYNTEYQIVIYNKTNFQFITNIKF